MSGEIDYRITGNQCAGYDTETRQSSVISAGEGTNRQEVHATAWEDGAARSYRFTSTTTASDAPRKQVGALVTRGNSGDLEISVSEPEARTLHLKGPVLLPTEHMRRVLAAATGEESHFAAKVYDGASDPVRIYDTLAIIGRRKLAEAPVDAGQPGLSPEAAKALEGHGFYPVVISYYEAEARDEAPDYVMSFALYDNGVLGNLKIDYGRFALVGTMTNFEVLGSVVDCTTKK